MSRAKKNRSIDENRAISQRVDELRMQGLNKERATAAAFRMFKDGELTELPGITEPGDSVKGFLTESAVEAIITKMYSITGPTIN